MSRSFVEASREELDRVLTEAGEVTARHDPAAALAIANDILQVVRARNDHALEAEASLVVAVALHRLHRLGEALETIQETEALFQALDDQSSALRCWLIHASILFLQGHGDAGEALLRDGIVICRASSNDRYLGVFLGNLSTILMGRGSFFEAIEALSEQRTLAEQNGWDDKWQIAANNLADCYLHLHDAEAAVAVATEALERQDDSPVHLSVRPHLIQCLGVAQEQLGQFDEALGYFQQSIAAAEAVSDLRVHAASSLEAARIARQLGQEGVARESATRLLGMLQQSGDGSLAPWVLLANAFLEDLDAAWVPETAHELQQLIDQNLLSERALYRAVFDLLVASLEGLGRPVEALAAAKAARIFDNDLWRDTLQLHNVSSAKAQQAREAQQLAEQERWRREELDQTLQEVRRLNTENESLVTQLTAQTETLETLSQTDGLTGVLNRRAFDMQLQVEEQRAATEGRLLAVGLFDVDDFKFINDAYSHSVGDEVLKRLSAVIEGRLRTGDTVARYGGDEFAVLVPGVPASVAQEIGDRVRVAVENEEWGELAPGLQVTVSGGFWAYDKVSDVAVAVSRADRLLYEAKHGGKNQVLVAPRTTDDNG